MYFKEEAIYLLSEHYNKLEAPLYDYMDIRNFIEENQGKEVFVEEFTEEYSKISLYDKSKTYTVPNIILQEEEQHNEDSEFIDSNDEIVWHKKIIKSTTGAILWLLVIFAIWFNSYFSDNQIKADQATKKTINFDLETHWIDTTELEIYLENSAQTFIHKKKLEMHENKMKDSYNSLYK